MKPTQCKKENGPNNTQVLCREQGTTLCNTLECTKFEQGGDEPHGLHLKEEEDLHTYDESILLKAHETFAHAFMTSESEKILSCLHPEVFLYDEGKTILCLRNAVDVWTYLVSADQTACSKHVRKAAGIECLPPNVTMTTYTFGFASRYKAFVERIVWEHVKAGDEKTVFAKDIYRDVI